jgi:hypothetical protein
MRICGVEIKGSEAVIALLELKDGLFLVPDCRARKVAIDLPDTSENIQAFQFAFKQLMKDYHVDQVVIKSRPTKGKFAGGAVGFKIEAAIQLIEGLESLVFPSQEINASIKRTPLQVLARDAGLKQFQELAYNTAYAYLVKPTEEQLLAEARKKEAKEIWEQSQQS